MILFVFLRSSLSHEPPLRAVAQIRSFLPYPLLPPRASAPLTSLGLVVQKRLSARILFLKSRLDHLSALPRTYNGSLVLIIWHIKFSTQIAGLATICPPLSHSVVGTTPQSALSNSLSLAPAPAPTSTLPLAFPRCFWYPAPLWLKCPLLVPVT